jgi:hypothetical protein
MAVRSFFDCFYSKTGCLQPKIVSKTFISRPNLLIFRSFSYPRAALSLEKSDVKMQSHLLMSRLFPLILRLFP